MKVTRRFVVFSGLAAAGALVVGWSGLPPRSRLGRADLLPAGAGEVGLNGWIKITAEGLVQLAMPFSEMGQGVHTALATIVAEELDLPLARVRLEQAGHDTLYANVAAGVDSLLFFEPADKEPGRESTTVRATTWILGKAIRELGINATGGSSSITDLWSLLALVAATTRAQLLGAASLLWKLPVAELSITDGVISHPSGPRTHFGTLAKAAAATPAGEVKLKPREQWKLVGRTQPRIDVPDKVTGRARFGIDVREPGLLYAAVLHAPQLGGSPGAVDVDAALKTPDGEHAHDPENLVCRAVRAVKRACPDLGVICDVALDPFTDRSCSFALQFTRLALHPHQRFERSPTMPLVGHVEHLDVLHDLGWFAPAGNPRLEVADRIGAVRREAEVCRADDADDLGFDALLGAVDARHHQALAQRIAIREVLLRQVLVDHHHRRAVGAVAFVETAPAQQRDTHGLEIAWIDDVQIAVRTGCAGRSFAACDLVGRGPVLVAERQVADHADLAHAGHGAHLAGQARLLGEPRARVVGVAERRRDHLEREGTAEVAVQVSALNCALITMGTLLVSVAPHRLAA